MKGLKNGGGVWDAREIYRRRDRTKYGSMSERCTASKGPERARPLISFRVRAVEPMWRFAHLQGGGTKKINTHPLLSDHPSIATSTRKQYNACTAASYSFTLSPTTSAITLLGCT